MGKSKICKHVRKSNAHLLKTMFKFNLDGKHFKETPINMEVDKHNVVIKAGDEILLSSEGDVHEEFGKRWFTIENNEPHYDRQGSIAMMKNLLRKKLVV